MQSKNNTKQRSQSIQGLRSFKDTLPKNVKKIINKKGQIYSETLSNWKYIVGVELFNVCYPKTFKNSNRFGVSTLVVMVKRGHEVDMEYSKTNIINNMNNYFGYSVVEKIKLVTFDALSAAISNGKCLNSIFASPVSRYSSLSLGNTFL